MLLELTGERSGQARRQAWAAAASRKATAHMLVPSPPHRPYHTDAPISFNWVVIILISKELNATMSRGTLGGREGARERINLHVVSRIIPRSIRHGNTPCRRPRPSVGCENTRGCLFENARAVGQPRRDGKYTGRLGEFDIQNGSVLNGISLTNCYERIKVAFAKGCKNKCLQGGNNFTFQGCEKLGEKNCAFFAYCRQENAIFPPHIHTTWEEPFNAALYCR